RDGTHYLISLPSNKLELWAAIESDRLQKSASASCGSEALLSVSMVDVREVVSRIGYQTLCRAKIGSPVARRPNFFLYWYTNNTTLIRQEPNIYHATVPSLFTG
ncbi:MAG: hypothetical protein PHR49_03350, partial [Methanoculleus sp.]|nr:hypothetical protein [Methanoculleus sp.]